MLPTDTPESPVHQPPSRTAFVPDTQVATPTAQSTNPTVELSPAPRVSVAQPIAQSTPSIDTRPKRTVTKPDKLGYSKLGG